MKRRIRRKRPDTTPAWYRGPDRHTREMHRKHGQALRDSLALRMARKALNSGRPWKYAIGRDVHTGLKRFLLRLIATIRETAR